MRSPGLIGLRRVLGVGAIVFSFDVQVVYALALKIECRTARGSEGRAYVTIFGKATGDLDIFQRIPENRSFITTEDSSRTRDSNFLEIPTLAKGHHVACHIVFWEDFLHPPAPPGELAYPMLAMTKRPEILSTLSWSASVLPTGKLGEKGMDPWLGSVAFLISNTGDSLTIRWMKPDTLGSLREIPMIRKSPAGTAKSFKVQGKKSEYSFALILE